MNDSETSGSDYGHNRRCDYCLEHKDKTRVEDLGSIICSDCDEERYQDTDNSQSDSRSES